MREHISDAITRRAADGITRRGSLMTLGGAGLAAIVRRLSDRRCQEAQEEKQEEEKGGSLRALRTTGGAVPDHVTLLNGNAAQLLCCDAFATCEATQFFLCLLTTPA